MRVAGGFRIRSYLISKNIEFATLKKNHDELVTLVASL